MSDFFYVRAFIYVLKLSYIYKIHNSSQLIIIP